MPLLSKTIPNLINGVSQQPAEVRLPSQADEQINFLSSVVDGLKRRPGTRHVASLMTTAGAGAFVHVINRDRFEKYIAVVLDGDIRVFDLRGIERTVYKPNGVSYLSALTPSKSIRAVTVADHTFILNRERITRAYNPTAGIGLNPVTQRFQTIRIAPLSAPYVDAWMTKQNKWSRCWGRYGATVNGRTYSQSAEAGGPSVFAAMLAAKLTNDLGRLCVNRGPDVDIPLGAAEPLFSTVDYSGTAAAAEYCARWDIFEGPHHDVRTCGQYATACSIIPASVVTVLEHSHITGYASPGGDIIPAAEATNNEAIINVRLGDYGTTYRVYVDGGQVASYTTSTTDRTTIGTDYIAGQLYSQLASNLGAPYQVSTTGNAILVRRAVAGLDFTLSCSDSSGGKAMVACKGRIQQFTDLPAVGFEGFTIKVAGQGGVEEDDYYVQFSYLDNGGGTSGSWREVAKKGLKTRPAPLTMPHRLVSNADGSFTFETIPWDGRVAGDEQSAPEPSFINATLSDVFFFKNRLGFLSDENVIFSEAGSFYNFYPTTVMQSLETHPIDVAVTNDKVSILRHAVPFNETLLLFSDQTQFILRGAEKLTRETVNIDVTTRFEASLDAKPVGAGKNVFFGVKHGDSASIREYYVDPEAKVNDAADVASHCPSYLRGAVVQLAASSNEDMVLALTDAEPSSLYAYKFYWQANEKVQSSWSRWDFGGVVMGFAFLDALVAVVIERGGFTYLELMDITGNPEPKSRGFKTDLYLDRLAYVPTGVQVPYAWTNDTILVDRKGNVFQGDARWALINGSSVALKDFYVGNRFKSYYRFSPLVLTDSQDRVAPLVGRLQLRFMTLNYVHTGFFEVGVQVSTRDPSIHAYNGRRLGSANNRLGDVAIDNGRFRFPVLGNAPETAIWIQSDSHLPCAFQAAEWEALYHRHSRPF